MTIRSIGALLLGLALVACDAAPPPAVPPPAAAPTAVEERKFVVFFDLGSARIPASQLAAVKDAAAAAREGAGKALDVVGHTDRTGSDRANDRLSMRRAEAVRAELRRAGVAAASITVRGAGESRPFMPTEDGVRANSSESASRVMWSKSPRSVLRRRSVCSRQVASDVKSGVTCTWPRQSVSIEKLRHP